MLYPHSSSRIMKDTVEPTGPFGTMPQVPSKGPDTMLKRIVLSISTVGKCGPMQVVKQPGQWKALITEKQNCSSSQTNYD